MSKREEIRRRRQQAARRNQLIVLGVVALAVIAVAAIIIYPQLQPVGEIKTIEAREYPLADRKTLGSAEAPVVIQVFSDFQCPFCRQLALDGVEDALIEQYVASGQVRYEYRHFVVVDRPGSNESRQAALASECAADQGQFWNYHRLVYTNWNGERQGAFSDKRLRAFAESLDLNMADFNSCFNASRHQDTLRADQALAGSLGLNSTPTMLINGQQVPNPLDLTSIKTFIDGQLP